MAHDDDEPSVRMALNGNENTKCRRAIYLKVDTLKKVDFWVIAGCPRDQTTMHNKFVLNSERDENGNIKQYKTKLVVRGNEHSDYNDDFFSTANFTIAKLMI